MREQTGPLLRATFQTIKSYTTSLAILGASYAGTSCLLKQLKEQEDVWNGVGGSIVTGILVGIRRQSFNVGCTAIVALASLTLMTEYSSLNRNYKRGEHIFIPSIEILSLFFLLGGYMRGGADRKQD